MVKPGNPELLERLRVLADPQRYKGMLKEQRTNYIQRAEQLLIERDLNEGDPNLQENERTSLLTNIDKALESLDWRIKEIDASLVAFQAGEQAGMNRKARRRLLKTEGVAKAAGVAAAVKGERAAKSVVVATNEEASSEDDSAGSNDEEEVS